MTENKNLFQEITSWVISLRLDSIQRNNEKIPMEINQALQKSELKNLWTYLCRNVKDEETALKVVKNLHFQNLKAENEAINSACLKAAQQKEKVNLEIARLEEKIKLKRLACRQSAINAASLQQTLSSSDVKEIFHDGHCRELQSQNESLFDYQKHFKTICLEYKQKSENKSTDLMQQFYSCCSEVKELLLSLTKQHHSALGSSLSESTDSWKIALRIISLYPADMVAEALVSLSKQDTEKLFINERDHAAEKSQEINVEEKPIAIVQAMMEKHHQASLEELQEAAANENYAAKTSEKVSHFVHQIRQQMSSSPNPHQREVFEAEIELKGKEAYLQSLQRSIQTLKRDIDDGAIVQRKLLKMQRKLKNFNKDLIRNKLEIIAATKQNHDLRTNLQRQQSSTINLARSSFSNEQPELSNLCTMLQSSLKDEMAALDSADVSQLFAVNVNLKCIPIYDLSIHRPLKTTYEYGGQAYQQVSSILGISSIKSPSDLLRDVSCKVKMTSMLERLKKEHGTLTTQSKEKAKEVGDTRSHVEVGKQQHYSKMKEWIDQAKIWIKTLQDEQTKLDNALTDWFDQPAQNEAPWLSVDGMDLRLWKQSKLI